MTASQDARLDASGDLDLRSRLDQPPRLPPADRSRNLREALRACKGSLSAFLDPLLGPGKLTIDEAIVYGLYREDLDPQQRRRFVGKRQQAMIHAACNNPHWFAPSHDKALFYTIITGAGLPAPVTRATISRKARSGFTNLLQTREAVVDFLTRNETWPVFLKPIDGIYSLGAMKLLGMVDGRVDLFGLGPVTPDELMDYMEAMSEEGYLLQDCLTPSPFAEAHFGPTVPSVRLLIFFSGAEPRVESAVLKIPSGRHVADNYWRGANMLGALALESGTIMRVVSGLGPDLVEHEAHPLTGKMLKGLVLPGWPEITAIGLKAASLFPGVRTQSWDIALTPRGPVLLEFNFGGDLNLHQLAHGRGAMTDSYVEHLRECGYRKKLV